MMGSPLMKPAFSNYIFVQRDNYGYSKSINIFKEIGLPHGTPY
jgi:hypothetical protein